MFTCIYYLGTCQILTGGGEGGGGGNIELKVGNEVTHLSNRNEISLPSPWA